MLSRFDWLRRCRTGAELLATLRYLEAHPEFPAGEGLLGPPLSALNGPCQRCWVCPRSPAGSNARYCPSCHAIIQESRKLGDLSRRALVVWGYVNQLPKLLRPGFRDSSVLGAYVHDENRFLVMLCHLGLKPWLQELAIYHGQELRGFLQVFPTIGLGEPSMGDLLARIVHHEARFAMDRLRVRFFSKIQQVFNPRPYEREGVLTFEITGFLSMLEMAAVFRTVLQPDEQQILYKLLKMGNTAEAQFQWGRFLGLLSQKARDLLEAWRIRWWSGPQVDLLYELMDHVAFYQPS